MKELMVTGKQYDIVGLPGPFTAGAQLKEVSVSNVHTIFLKAFVCVLLAGNLTACTTAVMYKPVPAAASGEKHIAIFLDGTRNDEARDTNVKRLHSLVSLQSRPDLATLYVEGVGTGSDILGMGLGVGFKARVKIAYQFLLENYKPGDKIYIFGFSRGAYEGRALTSLLYHGGLPAWRGHTTGDIADIVYDNVQGLRDETTHDPRREDIARQLQQKGLVIGKPVAVEVLGLWDTVEALGNPHWGRRLLHKAKIKPIRVNVDNPNLNHDDQLCNVRRAYQALSIDDDREWLFTPLLLSRKSLFSHCPAPADADHLLDERGNIRPGRLQEVWFSGAHSDVGGGYGDSATSGVSLNWMVGHLKGVLLPHNTKLREDWFGSTHDPESGWFAPLYHSMSRNIGAYVSDAARHREEFLGSVCVHESVLARRNSLPLKSYENKQLGLLAAGDVCLVDDNSEGFADPPRLKEGVLEAGQCRPRIKVQVWPACSGIAPSDKGM